MRHLIPPPPTKNTPKHPEISQYLSTIGEIPTMPGNNELSALYHAVRAGDMQAIEKAKRAWLKPIIEIAKQCAASTDVPFGALVAAGTEGLIKYMHTAPSEDKFLSFYAWNIKQAIMAHIK